MIKRTLWIAPLAVLIYGCSGGSNGAMGSSDDPWQVTSDRQNGGWEVVMLTSDQNAQDVFEKERGFNYSGVGDPVLWLKRIDGVEPYEPEIWAVDQDDNRTPFNYERFYEKDATYLAVSLVPPPTSENTFKSIQLEILGELIAEWSVRTPGFQTPSNWPGTESEGHELTLAGVDLKIVPTRRHLQGTENGPSSFRHSDEVEATAGIDEEFEYELRYTVPDIPEADYVSHFFNRTEQPQQGGFDGGAGGGNRWANHEQIDSYDANVICRLMKYQTEPFELTWDVSLATFSSKSDLESAQLANSDIDTQHFVVYGAYWNPEYYGGGNESLWLRVKGAGESRNEFSNELQPGWNSLFVEASSAGRLMDQYDLPDGSTVLVFEGSGMMRGWKGGEFTISGTLRKVADYEEKVIRMNLPVTRAAPADETDEE